MGVPVGAGEEPPVQGYAHVPFTEIAVVQIVGVVGQSSARFGVRHWAHGHNTRR